MNAPKVPFLLLIYLSNSMCTDTSQVIKRKQQQIPHYYDCFVCIIVLKKEIYSGFVT